MGIPIVIVASGGLPITEATNGYGTPVSPVASSGTPCTIVAAGMPVVGSGGGAPDAAQTTAFLARANAITTLDGTHVAAYKALINGLVADAVWAKLDALYILATQSSGVALLNLVSTSFSPGSTSNGPTFTADRGYTGNGLNASINMNNYNPSTAGGQWAQDSAHMMVWQVVMNNANAIIGNSNNSLIVPNFSGNVDMRVNDGTHVGNVAADPGNDGLGCYIASRTGPTTRTGYKNGTSLGSANSATSAAIDNSTLLLLGAIALNFTSGQVAASSVGGALTGTDASNFYNRLRTYMTAVGVP